MADWSWKQAVAKYVLEIVNQKNSPDFTLHEVYAYLDELARLFPRNTRVRQKTRQILQRLRDDEGFLLFSGKGHYRLNLGYEDLDAETAPLGQRGLVFPVTRQAVRNVRLRDTFLASEIKRRYNHLCQVCREPLPLSSAKRYAEGHHLKPLGAPHFGPDVLGNIIVLCPNHHLFFDRGVATIVPDSLALRHHVGGVFPRDARLYVQPWHALDQRYLEYHHQRFLKAR
jgi:hypothetical protein